MNSLRCYIIKAAGISSIIIKTDETESPSSPLNKVNDMPYVCCDNRVVIKFKRDDQFLGT